MSLWIDFLANWTLLHWFISPPLLQTDSTEAVSARQDNWISEHVMADRTGQIIHQLERHVSLKEAKKNTEKKDVTFLNKMLHCRYFILSNDKHDVKMEINSQSVCTVSSRCPFLSGSLLASVCLCERWEMTHCISWVVTREFAKGLNLIRASLEIAAKEKKTNSFWRVLIVVVLCALHRLFLITGCHSDSAQVFTPDCPFCCSPLQFDSLGVWSLVLAHLRSMGTPSNSEHLLQKLNEEGDCM